MPIIIEAAEARRRLRSTDSAPLLLLLGGPPLRWILLVAGQPA